MSQTAQLLHIVINTHCRQLTIPEATCQDLYSVIANLVKAKHCHLYCINDIMNQKAHHLTQPFETEFQKLILNSGKKWEEYMLT